MPRPTIACPTSSSKTGAYKISWQGPDGIEYRLEENGTVLYQGLQKASTVTGRAEGKYTYRVGVRASTEQPFESFSETCQVTVSPPSLTLAFIMFGMGLLVFLSVLILIIRGHRAHKRGTIG